VKAMLNVKQGMLINDKSQIGNKILAYLVENPKAQDTLEGIVEWWLLEREIKFETARVKEALSDLVAKGLILEKLGSNSKTHYRVNKSKHNEIQELFKQKIG
jgi:hypothetical protein